MKKLTQAEDLAQVLARSGQQAFLFTADWCGDCQFIYPVLDQLEAENPQVTFTQVDRDQFVELAQAWDIYGIPSLVVTENGQEIGRLVNRQRKTKEELTQFLQNLKENK